MASINIIQATAHHIDDIKGLFDDYRVYYKQESDLDGARLYLHDRLDNKESVIFIIYVDDMAVGFAQLYFTFSSISLQSSIILNDLYIDGPKRQKGYASLLLERVQEFAIKNNFKGVSLETGIDNPAQHLYERFGWEKDTKYLQYYWTNK